MFLALDTRAAKIWDTLSSSYWFIPSLLTITALLLATGLSYIDEKFLVDIDLRNTWLYVGEPQSARAILTTIASSMVSIASLTFSITIVALTLAVSQFGSRLLSNFMRDRGNQIVLGTFIGTFAYCLVILRRVLLEDGIAYVPHLSVSVAIVLAFLSIAVLIYFIHHVAESIQANNVIASVSNDLHRSIKRFFPEKKQSNNKLATDDISDFKQNSTTVDINRGGFIQAINFEYLCELAAEHGWVIKILKRPGDYIIENSHLLCIAPKQTLKDEHIVEINNGFILGNRRNLIQDIEFAFHQLVELALRALSPGINDPFTAMSCIDELGSGLALVMQRSMPPSQIYDDKNKLRIILDVTDFCGLVESAFNQIRQHGARDMAVMIRLLETIAAIAEFAGRQEEQQALLDQAKMIREVATSHAGTDKDKDDIDDIYAIVRNKLGSIS